jgi:hypothetical protein
MPAVQPLRQARFCISKVRIRSGGIESIGGRIAIDTKQIACIFGANRPNDQAL